MMWCSLTDKKWTDCPHGNYDHNVDVLFCQMVVGFKTNEDGERGDEILCHKRAHRQSSMGDPDDLSGCCDDCACDMLADGDFTQDELDAMYPVVEEARKK